jgi:hypothetical protein
VKDIGNDFVVVVEGILDPIDILYRFCAFKGENKKETRPFAFISSIDDRSRICYERLAHLNVRSMKLMVSLNIFHWNPQNGSSITCM